MAIVVILLLILIPINIAKPLEDHSLMVDLIGNIYDHLFTTTSFVHQPFQSGLHILLFQPNFHKSLIWTDKFANEFKTI